MVADDTKIGQGRALARKAERMSKQLLHLVMGGRVKDPRGLEFQDLNDIHVVGIYPNYAAAEEAWRGHAQRTVDDAEMKYVIVHLHRLLEPELPDVEA